MLSNDPDDYFLMRHLIDGALWISVFALVMSAVISGGVALALPLIPSLGFVHAINLTALVSAGIMLLSSLLLDQSIAYASSGFDEWGWSWWLVCSTRLGVIIMPVVWVFLSALLPWSAPILLAVSCAAPVVMLIAGCLGLVMGRLVAKAMIAYGHRYGYAVPASLLGLYDGPESYRVSVLAWATAYDYPGWVRFLCESGADPNRACISGAKPLVLAVRSGRRATLALLLANGANVNACDAIGRTPLSVAVTSCDFTDDVVDILLKAGADPNQVLGDGWTPLAKATLATSCGSRSDYARMESLLKAGANPNAWYRDSREQLSLPLRIAARDGDEQAVRLLLAYGADVNQTAEGGLPALTAAAIFGYRGVIELLVAAGANVNAQVGPHRRTAQYFVNKDCRSKGEPRYQVSDYQPRARRVLVGRLFDPVPRLYRFQLMSGRYTDLPPLVKGSIEDTTVTIWLIAGWLRSNPETLLLGKSVEVLPPEVWLLVLSMLVTMRHEVWQQDGAGNGGWRPSCGNSTLFDRNYRPMVLELEAATPAC